MVSIKNKKIITIIITILLALSSCSVFAATNYDLREVVTIPVKSQGSTGACWILAMETVLETNMALKNKLDVAFSARHMDYSTSQSFKNNELNPYGFSKEVNTGGTAELALAYLTNGSGPIEENQMPFSETFGDIALSEVTSKRPKYQVDKWVTFPSILKEYGEGTITYKDEDGNIYNQEKVNSIRNKIKEHIVENGAIYTGAHVLTDFTKYYNYKTYSYFCNDNTKATDHALVIIGWDDNYSRENFNTENKPKDNGAYIVQNSWGTDSRLNNGTYYISYEDAIIERELYGIVDVKEKNYDNIYQYDELGRNQYFQITGTNEAYGANVYTTKSDKETLTHVGISTYMDVGYELYINSENNEFSQENLIKVSEGILSEGYNTIYFEPLKITGEKFTVIVKYKKIEDILGITSISRYDGIGIDQPYKDITSEEGESYIGPSLDNMMDLYTEGAENTNLCIKAFTINIENGDVNGDGKISVTDLSLLKLYLVGIKESGSVTYGDINNDGKISAVDLSQLQEIIVKQ